MPGGTGPSCQFRVRLSALPNALPKAKSRNRYACACSRSNTPPDLSCVNLPSAEVVTGSDEISAAG
jgi:hypothetical protein